MERQAPPFPGAYLLDANFVAIPAGPLPSLNELMTRVSAEDLSPYFEPPLTVEQVMSLDPARGAAPSVQLESMRSQKSASVSNLRVEVHDRSGNWNIDESDLPDAMTRLSQVIGLEAITAAGCNYELTFDVVEGDRAANFIAQRLLIPQREWAPDGFDLVGGSGRLYFHRPDNAVFVVAIEPRLNDLNTRKVWMTSSFQITTSALPDTATLREAFLQAYGAMLHVGEHLLQDRIGVNQ